MELEVRSVQKVEILWNYYKETAFFNKKQNRKTEGMQPVYSSVFSVIIKKAVTKKSYTKVT